jgi:transaldolase
MRARVARPNIRVKVPATQAGLNAVVELTAAGMSVDVALIYSADRLLAAMAAIATGLEQASGRGRNLSSIAPVTSFSVCEMDTEVDKLLWSLGTDTSGRLRGSAALSNAHLAYQAYETCLGDERWQKLVGLGVRPAQIVWTSAQVRDPYYAETKYVEGLAAAGVAINLTEHTLDVLTENGMVVGGPMHDAYESAHLAMAALGEIGIDGQDVAQSLERKGAQALAVLWSQLNIRE